MLNFIIFWESNELRIVRMSMQVINKYPSETFRECRNNDSAQGKSLGVREYENRGI